MGKEIERKFLLKGKFKESYYSFIAESYNRIVQGYLGDEEGRSVRVRLSAGKAFITIKGMSSDDGLVRKEFEYEIPKMDAIEMFQFVKGFTIDKTRYLIEVEGLYEKGYLFEIDFFRGMNEGLVVIEVEFDTEEDIKDFNENEKPEWLGEEVTGISKYYNLQLSKNPFTLWKKNL